MVSPAQFEAACYARATLNPGESPEESRAALRTA